MQKRDFLKGAGVTALGLAAPTVWTGMAHAQSTYEGRMVRALDRHIDAAGMTELIGNTNRLAGVAGGVQTDGASSAVSASFVIDRDEQMSQAFAGSSYNALYGGTTLEQNTCLFNTRYTSQFRNFCLSYFNSKVTRNSAPTHVFVEGPALVVIGFICESINQEFRGQVASLLPSVRSACLPNTVAENSITRFNQTDVGVTQYESETTEIEIDYRRSTTLSDTMEARYSVANRGSGSLILEGAAIVPMNA